MSHNGAETGDLEEEGFSCLPHKFSPGLVSRKPTLAAGSNGPQFPEGPGGGVGLPRGRPGAGMGGPPDGPPGPQFPKEPETEVVGPGASSGPPSIANLDPPISLFPWCRVEGVVSRVVTKVNSRISPRLFFCNKSHSSGFIPSQGSCLDSVQGGGGLVVAGPPSPPPMESPGEIDPPTQESNGRTTFGENPPCLADPPGSLTPGGVVGQGLKWLSASMGRFLTGRTEPGKNGKEENHADKEVETPNPATRDSLRFVK